MQGQQGEGSVGKMFVVFLQSQATQIPLLQNWQMIRVWMRSEFFFLVPSCVTVGQTGNKRTTNTSFTLLLTSLGGVRNWNNLLTKPKQHGWLSHAGAAWFQGCTSSRCVSPPCLYTHVSNLFFLSQPVPSSYCYFLHLLHPHSCGVKPVI